MKLTKQITAIFMILSLLIQFTGCLSPANPDPSEPSAGLSLYEPYDETPDNPYFTRYTDDLFRKTVASDMLTLHTYIQNPDTCDIGDYPVRLPRYDLDKLDATAEFTQCINELNAFDRNTLSQKQRITYDELLLYMQTQLEYADLYLFETALSRTTGIQIQLPIILSEYSFNEEKDVQEYLMMLEDTDAFFHNLTEYEALRSRNGYFMEDSYADEIIAQCTTFIESAKDGYLVTTFDERINSLTTLSDSSKAAYKVRNRAAIEEHLIKGYQTLIDGIRSLKNTSTYSGGLSNHQKGRKYFESIIDKCMGWNKTIEEYEGLLDKHIASNTLAIQGAYLSDPTVMDRLDEFSFNITEPAAMLEDLKERAKADFPTGPDVNCSIKYISQSLKEYASPAMYFTPQLDNYTNNSIYINPAYATDPGLYTTMAHEGYPGHLYQITYFTAANPDKIRSLIEPGGYVEGWATYCELYSYRFSESNNSALNTLMAANYALVLCLYGKADIGVNYHSWSVDDLYKLLSNYGLTDRSAAEEMYRSLISEPGNYCKYVLGYIGFVELKDAAEKKLGSSFNLKDFHRFVLDMGPVQFDLLFKELENRTSLSAAEKSAA